MVPAGLSPLVVRRLLRLYWFAVIAVAVLISSQSLGRTEFIGPWIPEAWQPSIGFSLFLSFAVLSLVFVVRWPIWCLCAYVFVEHSSKRYSPELGYIYSSGMPEWMAILGAMGVALWWLENPQDRHKPRVTLLYLTCAMCAWAMISSTAAMLRADHLAFEVRHHPARYIDGLLLCTVAAKVIRQRMHFLIVIASLTAAITWRTLVSHDTLHLDGDVGELIAIAVPMLLICAMVGPHWSTRAVCAIGALYFLRLIFIVQSRGAGVGLVSGLFGLWLLSFRRWLLLIVMVPPLILGAVLLQQSGFLDRIIGSVPGGSTYSTVQSRLTLWGNAIRMSRDHWLIGVGPGNYALRMEEYDRLDSGIAAHSNYLSVLSELGAPGLLLYLTLFVTALVMLWRRGRRHASAWPCPEARAVFAALLAYLGAGAFISRHDQALAFILVGVAAALTSAGYESSLDTDE